MAGLTSVYPSSNLSTSIINGYAPLATLNKYNKRGHCKRQRQQNQNHDYMQLASPRQFKRTAYRRRQSRYNSRENYNRYAISYTAFTYLLTQPHQKYCSRNQGSNGGNPKTPTRVHNNRQRTCLLCFQSDGYT